MAGAYLLTSSSFLVLVLVWLAGWLAAGQVASFVGGSGCLLHGQPANPRNRRKKNLADGKQKTFQLGLRENCAVQ